MTERISVYASLLLSLALTSCLVPEKFTASVTVKQDGSYTYKYDGTATHVLAAMAIKQQGSLSPKDEADLKQDADKAAKANGVRKLSYLGKGHYDVSIEGNAEQGPNCCHPIVESDGCPEFQNNFEMQCDSMRIASPI